MPHFTGGTSRLLHRAGGKQLGTSSPIPAGRVISGFSSGAPITVLMGLYPCTGGPRHLPSWTPRVAHPLQQVLKPLATWQPQPLSQSFSLITVRRRHEGTWWKDSTRQVYQSDCSWKSWMRLMIDMIEESAVWHLCFTQLTSSPAVWSHNGQWMHCLYKRNKGRLIKHDTVIR